MFLYIPYLKGISTDNGGPDCICNCNFIDMNLYCLISSFSIFFFFICFFGVWQQFAELQLKPIKQTEQNWERDELGRNMHVCVCVCAGLCVFVLGPDDSDKWKTLHGSFFLSLHAQIEWRCVSVCVCVCVREVLTRSGHLSAPPPHFFFYFSLSLLFTPSLSPPLYHSIHMNEHLWER